MGTGVYHPVSLSTGLHGSAAAQARAGSGAAAAAHDRNRRGLSDVGRAISVKHHANALSAIIKITCADRTYRLPAAAGPSPPAPLRLGPVYFFLASVQPVSPGGVYAGIERLIPIE